MRNKIQSATKILTIPCMLLSVAGSLSAQMGSPGGDNSPAFSDPKFLDRLYESGGPRAKKAKNGALILSLSIEGNKSISENSIVGMMQCREDRVFDEESFNKDIADLYRTGNFKKIDPYFTETPQGVHIKLIVSEYPIVHEVLFTGNQSEDDRALHKHAGITKGDPLDPIRINAARTRLIEHYQDKGMNQVDVQIRSGDKPGDRVVDFLINEGPVERLDSISFIGNQAFSSEHLKAKIKSRDSRYGFTKYIGNKVSDNKLDNDKNALMGFYRSLGYFDARVDYRKDYDKSGRFVNVRFIINEGERYTVRSVSITGTKRYKPEELTSYLHLKTGEPFLLGNKAKDEKFIYELYGVQGHYFCDVVGELVYHPDHQVDVIYNVGEGDVYRISDVRVHIDGDFTKEQVVLQPLAKVRPGSLINSRDIENGARRLKFSQIFNTNPSQGIVPSIKVEPVEEELDDF